MNVTSVILAGGKNLRLGRNKALEAINGTSLIERVIDRLKPLSEKILIVTSAGQAIFPFPEGAEVVEDLEPDKGPLAGIYTGMLASSSSHIITVACDMPFLNTELLRYMLEICGDYDAVVPRLDDGKVEPLHAVYSRSCIDKMRTQLGKGVLKVYVLLKSINVRYVETHESRKIDPDLLSYFNINHQSDLDRAVAIAKNEKKQTTPD
jgi:molybdopterin-guanine dinucleotide biosynthesis protein A